MGKPATLLRRSALTVSIVLLFLTLLIVMSVPVLAAATVTLSTYSGPPGTSVTVYGNDFVAGETNITVTFDGSTMLSNITASAAGQWSGLFTIPASCSGVHTIYVYGSGSTATTYYSTTPAISLNKTSGAPGTSVTVTGSGFAASETGIKITFDGTSVTTGITASSTGGWSGTFNVPSSEAGSHSVKASGSSTTSVTAVTFTTSAGISLSKTSGPSGTAVTVNGSGFEASETNIRVTFDGDEVASGITAETTGSWTATFNIPISASGSHTVDASGASTSAATIANVAYKTTPVLSLNTSGGPPGSSVTVNGAGFGSSETNIVVTFDGKQVGSSTSANSSGSWSIVFTVPSSASGSHAIAASGSITAAKSVAAVTFNTGAGVSINKSGGTAGISVTVTGSGFAAGEKNIKITFDGEQVASDITASTSGAWNTNITIPSSASGDHTIGAYGPQTAASSVAGAVFNTVAMISVNQTSGSSGSTVTVTGSGYEAAETGIVVTFDGKTVASDIAADDNGSWTATFKVPNAASGSHVIKASGSSTEAAAASQSAFNVSSNVVLSPANGYVGSTVTVTGSGFAPDSPLRITYDGTEIPLNGAATDALGNINQSITIPVSKAGTHNIVIADGQGNTVKTTFSVSSTAPSIPSGNSPRDNSTLSITGGITPVFKWTAVTSENGITYQLQIAADTEFADIVVDKTGLQTNKYTLNASESLSLGQYYWRVKAIDLASNQSGWSETMVLKSGVMAVWLFALIIVLAVAVILVGLYFGLLRRILMRRREAITVSEVEAPVFSPGQWQALESGETPKEREAPRRIALPEVSKTAKTLPAEDQARLKVIMDFARSMPLAELDYDIKWVMDLVESQLQTQISTPVYEQILKGDFRLHYEPAWMRHPVYKDLTAMLQKQPILQKLDTFVTEVALCGTDVLSLIEQIHSQSASEIPADFLSRGGWSYLTAIYIDAAHWYAGKSLRDPSEREYIIEPSGETGKDKAKRWLSGEAAALFVGRLILAQDEQEAQTLRTLHLKLRRTWRNNDKVSHICSSITQLQLQRNELLNAFSQFGRTR